MAIERANNGNVPVDALLGALRRAAEEDGVDDVDAVVAEFATFVRAQAPQLASAPSTRRQGTGWTTAVLAAGALTTAVFGAVASGLVANPLIDTGSSGPSGPVAAEAAPVTTLALDAPAANEPGDGRDVDVAAPMGPLDPDALAVIEAQQSGADSGADGAPVLSTSPTPTDPASASSNSPTSNPPTSNPPTSPTSTTSTTIPGDDDPSDDDPSDDDPSEDDPNQDGNEDSGDGDGSEVVEPLGATAADPGAMDEPLQPLEMPHDMPSATVPSLDDQGGVG